MKITEYTVSGAPERLTLAVAADLHGNPHEKVLDALEKHRPDLILIPGDLMEDSDLLNPDARGYAFLRVARKSPRLFIRSATTKSGAITKATRGASRCPCR